MSEQPEWPETIEVDITYLEMRLRPTARVAAPLIDGLLLQRAHNPPVHFYRYLYNAIGKVHIWTDRLRIDEETLRSRIHDPKVEIWVLSVAAAPAGLAEIDFNDYPDEEEWAPGTAQILYFGLVPDFQGRGLGRYLLNAAAHRAFEAGATRLYLHTNSLDHPRALPNYQRAGFSPFKRDKGQIRPLTDAEKLKALV